MTEMPPFDSRPGVASQTQGSADVAVMRVATIANRRGLHARAAAKFVKLAGQFQADILVIKRGTEVSGLSIMGLMMLAAGPGCSIELKASGRDAGPALAALVELIESKFGEE